MGTFVPEDAVHYNKSYEGTVESTSKFQQDLSDDEDNVSCCAPVDKRKSTSKSVHYRRFSDENIPFDEKYMTKDFPETSESMFDNDNFPISQSIEEKNTYEDSENVDETQSASYIEGKQIEHEDTPSFKSTPNFSTRRKKFGFRRKYTESGDTTESEEEINYEQFKNELEEYKPLQTEITDDSIKLEKKISSPKSSRFLLNIGFIIF